MPVLDGSIVQLQLCWRRTPSSGVLLADAAHILLDRLLADGHPPGRGLQWNAGGIKLQRTSFLRAESGPVRGIVGGQDLREAGRDPVRSLGDRLNGRAYLGGLLVLQHVTESAGAHRGPDRERLVGGGEDEDGGSCGQDRGYVALDGRPVAEVEVQENHVRMAARAGQDRIHGGRHGDDPDAAPGAGASCLAMAFWAIRYWPSTGQHAPFRPLARSRLQLRPCHADAHLSADSSEYSPGTVAS